ncbi:carbohydrate ABC transporter permease [Halosimplex aquaticum]|uniref:Carbohydrate ABC transporter permease n=1 Tax=Halosimplex aquaticum TaxID=3026162 RepID=A0ABD5Y482_9EURY|nr:sugar ABC transporter permease [Halosimplex aquaticum]
MSIRDQISSYRRGEDERRRQTIGTVNRETIEGYLWSIPYLAAFVVFLLWPLVKGLYMSFHDWNPLFPSESTWIGLENYIQIVNDPFFWSALWNTIYFVALTVPTMVVLSLGLALGVNRNVAGKKVLRTIFFSPYVLTIAVVAIVWLELLSVDFGPINYYLGILLGISPQWLTSRLLAMPSLAVTTIWWLLGFNFIILLAGRQSIPERLYEAARLDGAGTWRAFRDITLPQMRNSILFVVIIQFILQFQVFGQPYIMTGGGPAQSTRTIVYYLYQSAFNQQAYGYAAAIGYILFAILVGISLINYFVIGGDADE